MQHSNCTSKSATTGHQRLATWRRLIGLHNGVPEHGIVGGSVDVSGERWREKISYETRRDPDVSVTSHGEGGGGGSGKGVARLSARERGHLMAVTARLQRMMRARMAALELMVEENNRKSQVGFTGDLQQ